MKFVTLVAALAAAVPSALGVFLNTPNDAVYCEWLDWTWENGSPPYTLSILPYVGGAPLQQYSVQSGTGYEWLCNLAPGTQIVGELQDNAGSTSYSQTLVVQSSGFSC